MFYKKLFSRIFLKKIKVLQPIKSETLIELREKRINLALYFCVDCLSNNDVKLTKNLDSGRGDGFSVGVPGMAGVYSRVLRVHAQQVQGNIVKIIRRTETMSYMKQNIDISNLDCLN